MDGAQLRLKFWGVRGSTPTPQIENLKFGGNTPCVEIRTAGNECDLRWRQRHSGAGPDAAAGSWRRAHQHEDFSDALSLGPHPGDSVFCADVCAAKSYSVLLRLNRKRPLQETLEGQMSKPYFPVDFTQVAAKRDFHQIEVGGCVKTEGGLYVRPFPLNHPQGSFGVPGSNVQRRGEVVYATDYEHGVKEYDDKLREYAQDADILICDSQYTPAEYESHKGWGHSTWANAVFVAREAKANHLILFHHDPGHDDQAMMRITQNARIQYENTTGAWEGFVAAL